MQTGWAKKLLRYASFHLLHLQLASIYWGCDMVINIEPHKTTPPETTKEQKRRLQDEITRQIAEYLAKGNKIDEIPTGLGAGNRDSNF
jgi:hypothetical protein